jgi:uridylate kinase
MDSKYKRVLLKVSGEAMSGAQGHGIDDAMLRQVASQVADLRKMGLEIALVVGGGNFWRGRSAGSLMERSNADYIGMLATCMNGLALQEALRAEGLPVCVMSAIPMPLVMEPYSIRGAKERLARGEVLIFAGGIGCPFFSTDTTAALRAAEIGADGILLAKNVDAVYSADPKKDPNAERFSHLSHQEVLERRLGVMDATAASICMENHIAIHVFGAADPDNILRAARGEAIGTVIE